MKLLKPTRAALRSYAHSTSMQLRDPGPQYVRYRKSEALPFVRTGNIAFDALFALAGAEMRQNAVTEIRDGNYNGGAPIACECFATGEKWHYVWTRDLSYAADLGLAMLDPQRVRNSLEFKLSGYRPGIAKAAQVAGSRDGLQVVQDTGSGGSWPVSTDRVAWAFAAEKVLKLLPPEERVPFARHALKALSNTPAENRGQKTGDRPQFAKNRGQTTIPPKPPARSLILKPNLDEYPPQEVSGASKDAE